MDRDRVDRDESEPRVCRSSICAFHSRFCSKRTFVKLVKELVDLADVVEKVEAEAHNGHAEFLLFDRTGAVLVPLAEEIHNTRGRAVQRLTQRPPQVL